MSVKVRVLNLEREKFMELRIPELKPSEPVKEDKKPKILTPEYVRELNRGIAYRMRQIEASHARAEEEYTLTRKLIMK